MAVKKVLTSGLENRYTSFYHDEYLIDDGEDIAFVPRNCAPGSLAYTVDLSKIYQLSNALEWVEVSSGGGGEGKVTSVNGMTGDVTLTAEDIGAATEEYVDEATAGVSEYGVLDAINELDTLYVVADDDENVTIDEDGNVILFK